MRYDRRLWAGLLAITMLCGTGCEYFGSAAPDDLSDDLGELGLLTEPNATIPSGEKLALALKVGDRFPLQKTVEQTLSQVALDGVQSDNWSRLELLLSITVDEIAEGRKKLGVRYHHVRYSQLIAGERVEYDSNIVTSAVPPEAQFFHGMLNNGFSFWIDENNQIVELVDFDAFLKRCVSSVPAAQQQVVLARLLETKGEEEIANFIDDSIGLLPSAGKIEGEFKLGSTWEKSRQVVRPLPLYETNRYTLTELNDKTAEINIQGTMAASTTYGPSNQPGRVNVSIISGQAYGQCTIDRRSGLPVQSRVERSLTMQVDVPSGDSFEQSKQSVTTIRIFPEQGIAGAPRGGQTAGPIETEFSPPGDAGMPGEISNAHYETSTDAPVIGQ